jgi:hypothetical protein
MLHYVAVTPWRVGEETTPWYPSLRLFRQKKFGDYAEVIHRVVRELMSYRP